MLEGQHDGAVRWEAVAAAQLATHKPVGLTQLPVVVLRVEGPRADHDADTRKFLHEMVTYFLQNFAWQYEEGVTQTRVFFPESYAGPYVCKASQRMTKANYIILFSSESTWSHMPAACPVTVAHPEAVGPTVAVAKERDRRLVHPGPGQAGRQGFHLPAHSRCIKTNVRL